MITRQPKTIIYVNYSPYENSGKILTFLLDNFENVYLFSLGFYSLKNKKKYNKLLIYQKGNLKKEHTLLQIPMPVKLFFILLPFRSIITLAQIIFYSLWLRSRYGNIELYFTVNAFTAWIGSILKKMHIVDKTIFWVWDYYPPIHENKIIMLMRYIYWQFDKISSYSNRVAFVNSRLLDLRKDIGIYQITAKHPIVPIGTDKLSYKQNKNFQTLTFGFIGVLKKSQGFDIVFKNADALSKKFSDVSYEVIGSGPDEEYFKKIAKKYSIKTTFYGYLEGESFNDVLKKCTIGIATYIPDASNVSHYGDPGKIKRYLSLGIPVIATNVLEFSKEIKKSKAGIIIDYNNPGAFIDAVNNIMTEYAEYSKNAYKLSQKYYYKKIYPQMFDFS